MSCNLQLYPSSTLKKNVNFTLRLRVQVRNQANAFFNSLIGKVDFSSTINTLTYNEGSPEGVLIKNQVHNNYTFYHYSYFRISGTGNNENISARVSYDGYDDVSCECSTKITVEDGICVYGDYSQNLFSKLQSHPELSDKKFMRIHYLTDFDACTGLIVNYAGSNWYGAGQINTSSSEAIQKFYESGRPVIIAHDSVSETVADSLLNNIWGMTSASRVRAELATLPGFTPQSHTTTKNITLINPMLERFSDIYLLDEIKAEPVVTTLYDASNYSCIISTIDPAPRAVFMNEAILHPWNGEYGGVQIDETQWWESNEQLVLNIIKWVFE